MHQVVKILSIGFINVKKVCKYVTILEEFGKVQRHKRASFKKKSIRAAPVLQIIKSLHNKNEQNTL